VQKEGLGQLRQAALGLRGVPGVGELQDALGSELERDVDIVTSPAQLSKGFDGPVPVP
jgi:hypothetical protein